MISMTRDEALATLISVRHFCFLRGVLGGENDFREAFRTLNRFYVALRTRRT